MIRFIQNKIAPVAIATLSVISSYAMEIVTDTKTTTATTTTNPVVTTPVVLPSFLTEFSNNLTKYENEAGAGIMCCLNTSFSTTKQLAAQASVVLTDFNTNTLPVLTKDMNAIVAAANQGVGEAMQLIEAVKSFSSLATTASTALKSYDNATTTQLKGQFKPEAKTNLTELIKATHTVQTLQKHVTPTVVVNK